MRRRAALLAAGLLAGATMSVTGGTPAQAQVCTSTDPVVAMVCDYYQEVGEAAYRVYCKVWPPCR